MNNIRLFAFACLLAASFLVGEAYADSARIVNIHVTDRQGSLVASADLHGVFDEEVKEAFYSGVPVTITYSVNLQRSRTVLWDATEKEVKIHKVVKYDSFAKEFNAIELVGEEAPDPDDFEKAVEEIKQKHFDTLFSKDPMDRMEFNRRYLSLKDMSTLENWILSLREVPLGFAADYQQGARYYVEVKAAMDSPHFRGPLNYILFFVSFLEFETDWENSTAFVLDNRGAPLEKMVGRKESK